MRILDLRSWKFQLYFLVRAEVKLEIRFLFCLRKVLRTVVWILIKSSLCSVRTCSYLRARTLLRSRFSSIKCIIRLSKILICAIKRLVSHLLAIRLQRFKNSVAKWLQLELRLFDILCSVFFEIIGKFNFRRFYSFVYESVFRSMKHICLFHFVLLAYL